MPRTQQRIERIGRIILEQAGHEALAVREAADAEHQAALTRARDEALGQMYTKIRAEVAAVKKETALRRATAWKTAHGALLSRRAALTDELFAAAEQRLLIFAATPEYPRWMEAKARSLGEKTGPIMGVLTVGPRDAALLPALCALFGPGCAGRTDAAITLGGFTLEDEPGGILYDESLGRRLRAERPWFLAHCGMKVV